MGRKRYGGTGARSLCSDVATARGILVVRFTAKFRAFGIIVLDIPASSHNELGNTPQAHHRTWLDS